ncbi:hypothetical protein AAFF_G00305650 [Aldrovandia affinis]|uniref:Uncharacterized protein n=1 Tax=Aldrovandia affinis TaxID=143900 RepID=A0AAD7WS47_9TELE|nr:hypothetical protein AAFF_G00305650 [Aldrovandia affinis]
MPCRRAPRARARYARRRPARFRTKAALSRCGQGAGSAPGVSGPGGLTLSAPPRAGRQLVGGCFGGPPLGPRSRRTCLHCKHPPPPSHAGGQALSVGKRIKQLASSRNPCLNRAGATRRCEKRVDGIVACGLQLAPLHRRPRRRSETAVPRRCVYGLCRCVSGPQIPPNPKVNG